MVASSVTAGTLKSLEFFNGFIYSRSSAGGREWANEARALYYVWIQAE